MGKSISQLYAENPRRDGESQWSYQQRIGAMMGGGTGGQGTDLTPFVSTMTDLASKLNPLTAITPFMDPSPQRPNETDMAYAPRRALSSVVSFDPANSPIAKGAGFVRDGVKALPQTFANGLSTPAARAATSRPFAPPSDGNYLPGKVEKDTALARFPTSFKDPVYDQADQQAAARFGVPVEILSGIRLRGERTNAGVRSSAGAWTPYQIIPGTRQGIMDKYKFDPYISPKNAAMGAAALLAENYKKTGDWPGAVQAYVGGFGPANAKNQGIRDEYVARVMGNYQDAMSGAPTGYDPKYANMALGELNNAQEAAKRPFSVDQTVGPMPEVPEFKTVAPPDFSAAHAELKATQPAAMTMAEQRRTRRADMFGAMGQALAALPENAGVGKILAVVGGAALAGRMAGDKEIQARMDKYDEDMAKFHVAMAQQDNFEASKAFEAASANVSIQNQNALLKYNAASKLFDSNNNLTVSPDGTRVMSSTYDPKTGVRHFTSNAIPGAIDALFAMRRAAVFEGQDARSAAVTEMDRRAYSSAALGAAANAASAAPQGSNEQIDAIGTGAAIVTNELFENGRGPELVGTMAKIAGQDPDEAWKNLTKQGSDYATSLGFAPGTPQFAEAVQKFVQGQVASASAASPTLRTKLAGMYGEVSNGIAARKFSNTTTTTRSGPKGTTTTTRADGGDQ